MSGPEHPNAATWPAAPERAATQPHRPRPRYRTAAIVGTVAALLGSLVLAFFALVINSFACWDSCDEGSGQWQDAEDAWQYDFQLLWALGGVGIAIAALVLAVRGHLRAAVLAVLATGITFAGWWEFVSIY